MSDNNLAGNPYLDRVPEPGYRPLSLAEAQMFLGRQYDRTQAYRRNRLTGEIEAVDSPAAQTSAEPAGGQERGVLASVTESSHGGPGRGGAKRTSR